MVVFLILNVKPTKADHSEWLHLVGPYSEAPHHGISRIYGLPQQELTQLERTIKAPGRGGTVLLNNRWLPPGEEVLYPAESPE